MPLQSNAFYFEQHLPAHQHSFFPLKGDFTSTGHSCFWNKLVSNKNHALTDKSAKHRVSTWYFCQNILPPHFQNSSSSSKLKSLKAQTRKKTVLQEAFLIVSACVTYLVSLLCPLQKGSMGEPTCLPLHFAYLGGPRHAIRHN